MKALLYFFPADVVRHIQTFIPKPGPKHYPNGLSRELTRIQKSPKFKSAMWLYGLEDFMLE